MYVLKSISKSEKHHYFIQKNYRGHTTPCNKIAYKKPNVFYVLHIIHATTQRNATLLQRRRQIKYRTVHPTFKSRRRTSCHLLNRVGGRIKFINCISHFQCLFQHLSDKGQYILTKYFCQAILHPTTILLATAIHTAVFVRILFNL